VAVPATADLTVVAEADISVTYTITCTIDPSATGTLSNTVMISGSVTDNDRGKNSATDDDTVLTPEADLSIAKTDGQASVFTGTNLTYTLTVFNNGPSDSSGGSISDVLPAGLSFVSSASGSTGHQPGASSVTSIFETALPVISYCYPGLDVISN